MGISNGWTDRSPRLPRVALLLSLTLVGMLAFAEQASARSAVNLLNDAKEQPLTIRPVSRWPARVT